MKAVQKIFLGILCVVIVGVCQLNAPVKGAEPVKLATFCIDASPPVGSPLAYDPCEEVLIPLTCRGVILLPPNQKPIVLCSVDWIGIANDCNKCFRRALAEAVGTVPERVAVHTVHQHDAPECDLSANQILEKYGINKEFYDPEFLRSVIQRAQKAAAKAIQQAQPVTHIALGQAKVEKVASNRRILGPDGKVQYVRWTACKDPKVRAAPVGVIDPYLKLIAFWNEDKPLVALTYYACHPQSYYRTKKANPDFPGIARNQRQKETGVLHIHFDGAGGNIGAGKWNDGSPENRPILAARVAKAMKQAWENARKEPLKPEEVGWKVVSVALPPAPHLEEKKLLEILKDEKKATRTRKQAARDLAWLRRCLAGERIDLMCLRLGRARILHMPGELFVEYQLTAQQMRPDLFVAMAAYGDYGPGYIGTRIAYWEGGYETSPRASRVAPDVEDVLLAAIRQLLND